MAGVWILADNRDRTLELLSVAVGLAEKLNTKVAAFLWNDLQLAQDYIAHGADEVLFLAPLEEDQPLEAYIPVIAEEARREDPDIFLVAATVRGKEMAARIAARLNTGLCSGCTALFLDETDNKLVMERLVYGGAAVQTVTCLNRPQMATIAPRTFAAGVPSGDRTGQVREIAAPPPGIVKIVDRKSKGRQSGNVSDAKVLICVGRGLEKEEDLALARNLADVLGGELACTRSIAEEMHWLPEETYIGLSGQKVKPDVYIGVGVSGQIQHVTGIRDARLICAINRDENAIIFDVSDFGIVGDLYTVLPELTREFKRVLGKE
jgi:electron transfer flavoprotein alpha subunit